MIKSLHDAFEGVGALCTALAKQTEDLHSESGLVLFAQEHYPTVVGSLGNLLKELGQVKLVE